MVEVHHHKFDRPRALAMIVAVLVALIAPMTAPARPKAYPITMLVGCGGPLGNDIITQVGSTSALELTLTIAGDFSIKTGDSLEIWETGSIYMRPSWDKNGSETIARYISTDGKANLDLKVNLSDFSTRLVTLATPHPIAFIRVISGELKKGNRIYIRIGDTSAHSPAMMVIPRAPVSPDISLYLKRKGAAPISPADSARVNIIGGPVKSLRIIAPSSVVAGETFSVLARADDEFSNLAGDYGGTMLFNAGGLMGMPQSVSFSIARSPVLYIDGISAPVAGTYRISACDLAIGLCGVSNPIEVTVTAREKRIFWGDLHCHAYDVHEIPVAIEFFDPREIYRRARDEQRLDFLAITPHVFHEHPGLPAKWWPLEREGYLANYRPGAFVTFLGYEWRGVGGDHNIIYPGDMPAVPTPENSDIFKMYDQAAGAGALVIPHVGGDIGNLSYHDDRVQRAVEITSNHRHSEWYGNRSLDYGYHTAFVGGSDDHTGNCGGGITIVPGLNKFSPDFAFGNAVGHGGLTAVFSPDLTRENIFGALKNRKTYATTGARIILKVDVDAHGMGEEFTSRIHPTIKVSVAGTNDLEIVEIIRSDLTIYQQNGNGPDMDFTFTDPDPPAGENYYYVRVTQIDDEIAWSSPIWVTQEKVEATTTPNYTSWNYDRFEDSSDDEAAEALQYSGELNAFLDATGAARLIPSLIPYKVVHALDGNYIVFTGFDPYTSDSLRVEYFIDRNYRVLRIWRGAMHYGQYQ